MKMLAFFVFLSLLSCNSFAMESEGWRRGNPFALLSIEGDDEQVEPAVSTAPEVSAPAPSLEILPRIVTLYDIIRSNPLNALDIVAGALDHGYNVNERSRGGKNTILHAALILGNFDCAYLIASKSRGRINLSLRNKKGETALDCAYASLAALTISIKLGNDVVGDFYYVTRYQCSGAAHNARSRNVKRSSLACGESMKDVYVITYAGKEWGFDAAPICSARRNVRGLERCHDWQGWVDVVCPLEICESVDFLRKTIEMLGGDELGFARFLFPE